MRKLIAAVAVAAGAIISMAANASSITIDSVQQRWPWNNKVDITYTIGGGQDLANGNYQKIVFTTVINGATLTVEEGGKKVTKRVCKNKDCGEIF